MKTETIITIVYLCVFAVIGTIGNGLVLYVFTKPRQKFTSSPFILTLAGIDLITCLVIIPFTVAMEIINFEVSNDIVCKMYQFLITTTIPFSALVMVAIAVDRYFCICRPFVKVMTCQRVRIMVTSLFMIAVCLGMLSCLNFGIFTEHRVKEDLFKNNGTDLIEHSNSNSSEISTNGITKVNYNMQNIDIEQQLRILLSEFNITSNEKLTDVLGEVSQFTNKQQCHENYLFFGKNFFSIFKSIYASVYGACGILVIAIYIVIYRFILHRRQRRLRMESFPCCTFKVPQSNGDCENTEVMYLSQDASMLSEDKYGDRNHNADTPHQSIKKDTDEKPIDKFSLGHQKRERIRRNNIKTAIMLSMVALVFVVAFLPAWLMKIKVIEMNIMVFNMYFIYNIINPFLYTFMNPDFQMQLKEIFSNMCR